MNDSELELDIWNNAICGTPLTPDPMDDLHKFIRICQDLYSWALPHCSEATLDILLNGIKDAEALLARPGTLFNIPRAGGEVRLRAVAPGDAHESDWGFVTEPDTLPTAFPAAPAAPEICKLAYYGIRCDIQGCQDEVHTRRRNL